MNTDEVQQLWVDKYRPSRLEEYVLNNDIKDYFRSMISTKALQNFTMIGCPGSGKTTLAKIISNEFDAETLFIKCATDGTLDVLRTRISEFCNAMSIEGKIKIVILDEVDSATSSGDNNFQKGLRTLIESAQDDTRFILTANYQKIIPAVLSRCPIIPLKYDKKDLLVHLKKILDAEKIDYDKTSVKAFIEEAFQYYPDCRKIVNYLQLCCNSGKLVVKLNNAVNSDRENFVKEIVERATTEKNILNVRKFYLQNKEKIDDFMTFASEIFNYSIDNNIVVDAQGILKMTDILYYINMVVDKEPVFFGLISAIYQYGKK